MLSPERGFVWIKKRKKKIAFNCNIAEENVVSAPDVENIYDVPLNFEKDKLSDVILKKLKLKSGKRNLGEWQKLAKIIGNAKKTVKIGIVGKYFATGDFVLSDAYISVIEAIKHASYFSGANRQLNGLTPKFLRKKIKT